MPTVCCANCKYITQTPTRIVCGLSRKPIRPMNKCERYECFAQAKRFKKNASHK